VSLCPSERNLIISYPLARGTWVRCQLEGALVAGGTLGISQPGLPIRAARSQAAGIATCRMNSKLSVLEFLGFEGHHIYVTCVSAEVDMSDSQGVLLHITRIIVH